MKKKSKTASKFPVPSREYDAAAKMLARLDTRRQEIIADLGYTEPP